MTIKLCVNVDHIATLRQARGGVEPDPIEGAKICEEAGAHGITVHLREDRRHISDQDVEILKERVKGKFNLEMALSDEIIEFALKIAPDQITLVPEKREELTTEGGLDVQKNFDRISSTIQAFKEKGIIVSLFIEPDTKTVELSKKAGADYIEIHTGTYCNADNQKNIENEIQKIYTAARLGHELGIGINAGHGLNYTNIIPVIQTPALDELNIGHSIISRSLFTGLHKAVSDMIEVIKKH